MQKIEASTYAANKTLVVALHGFRFNPGHLEDLSDVVRQAYGQDTIVETPAMPYQNWWSGQRATRIIIDLLSKIDRFVETSKPERIVLIGHSTGATVIRRAFLVAAGYPENFRPEHELACEKARPWAARVERVILLAAFNRGWQISPRMSWCYSNAFAIIAIIGHFPFVRTRWTPTVFDFRLGAPFMAQTRLHWLAFRRQQQSLGGSVSVAKKPILIQIIGTKDDLIAPFDQVDIVVDGSGSAIASHKYQKQKVDPNNQDYFLIEQPYTGHNDAICFQGNSVARNRRDRFIDALKRDRSGLATLDLSLDPVLLSDEIDPIEPHVKNTVFVIHGIRDDGYWTHRIAERIRQAGGRDPSSGATIFRSWTPTYGYFAMGLFILPWIRREKVEWFMDQYVTAFAQYPESDFHFVGHSNGCYLAARALRDYPALHFKHILFAGSVVRGDYDWYSLIENGRVARFQNICAASDWVVAWFPKSLEWISSSDIGGAGFDGFENAGKLPEINEFKFVRGHHSAAIAEIHWERIAEFIINGTPFSLGVSPDPKLYESYPNPYIAAGGRARIGIAIVLIAVSLVSCVCFYLGSLVGSGGLFGLLVAALIIRFFVIRF